jgi:transcriptional regulator with GAF, ATPase, and Fis domain
MVGESEAVRAILQSAEQVARTDSTVLVTGETGTGKELVAHAIHSRSDRRNAILVKVNCAALPAGLIESELFGHEKGAFTGALSRKIGRFEMADGGTIFLDEIGDLPLELQAKLLRVLQEGEFERVGGTTTLRTNARVIAATNHDLATAVDEQRFRDDLYYRLNVFPIHIPPLRRRTEDIPLLAHHFALQFATRMGRRIESIPAKTMDALMRYRWPGNVRELQNVIERAVIISQGSSLELGEWPPRGPRSDDTPTEQTLEEVERKHILATLDHTNWRVSGAGGAAGILGLKPSTLESRMKKLGITRPT